MYFRAIKEGYRTFHKNKVMDMMNEVFREHNNYGAAPCPGALQFDTSEEIKWGFAWFEKAKCEKCHYSSKVYKLFEEVKTGKRGRRAATINVGISIAMTQTPIGPTSLRHIFHGGNIPAPSRSGMQQTAKRVASTIIKTNKADMKCRTEKTKRILRMRNRPDNEFAVQSDSVYNNNLFSAIGKSPFQAGTQAVYTVAENVTCNHDIIEIETVNKLCSKEGYHDSNSMGKCNILHSSCSATHPMEDNIGDEKRWAKSTFQRLKEQAVEVKYLTTDPDTAAFKAVEEMHRSGETTTKPIHQIDTRHLSKNHRKFIRNSEKVLKMMPGHTVKLRKEQRNGFAFDLSQRCYAEINQIHQQQKGQFDKIRMKVEKCIQAMLKCYAGNHSDCKENSAVCKGESNNNWFCPSTIYLNASFKINTDIHKQTFLDCVNYRLGPERLILTRLNTNSQKVEGTNRAIKRSLPPNVTFTRCFESRAHSAIHRVNNGPGRSLAKLLVSAGCPICPTGKVARALNYEQLGTEKKKDREKTLEYKQKRKLRKVKIYNLYKARKEIKNYQRGMLLHMKAAKRSATNILKKCKKPRDDHSYSRKPPTDNKATFNMQAAAPGQEQDPDLKHSCL
jgi:hypothetical protein